MKRPEPHHANIVLDAIRSPGGAAASSVVASWCRSALHHGLDPAGSPDARRIDAATLHQLREQHAPLLLVARPIIDQLFRTVGRSGCCVVLSDARGVILEERHEAGDQAAFAGVGLTAGGHWGEAEQGTNGIGTCLHEDRAVVIHRDQHFASRNTEISCADAPVYDPEGRLIAALDVSSCRHDHGIGMAEMTLALVRDAARRIERACFSRHFAGARIVFLGDDPRTGSALLALDRDDLVIGASRAARARLRVPADIAANPRPVNSILGTDAKPSFEDGDRAVLRRALASVDGNASKAARLLGISRATLYRRMARAGLGR